MYIPAEQTELNTAVKRQLVGPHAFNASNTFQPNALATHFPLRSKLCSFNHAFHMSQLILYFLEGDPFQVRSVLRAEKQEQDREMVPF